MKDIAVVGGGAAGLFFAIRAKQTCPQLAVVLYEAKDRVGKKIAITGNGRCNISNKSLMPDCYHGDRDFAWKCLQKFGFDEQKSYFEDLGIYFKLEGEKAYPNSLQAASVVDALRFTATEIGVEIITGSEVKSVKRNGSVFLVETDNSAEKFRSVVVATGGKAGGKLGGSSGYDILKSLGHKIEPIFPSLVQLKTDTSVVRQLKGIKVDANVTIRSSYGERTEFGEVLFCDYGLSGPPVLQVSRLANGENARIILDLMPDFSEQQIVDILSKTVESHPLRANSELFTGLLNKRLGQVITKMCGVALDGEFASVKFDLIRNIAKTVKCFELKVNGTTGFENAQVTAGGAQTAQFFDNFMSKKAKGLFAIGEVLDVDGDCGGYNLAFAWASAFVAAEGAVDYLLSGKNDNNKKC